MNRILRPTKKSQLLSEHNLGGITKVLLCQASGFKKAKPIESILRAMGREPDVTVVPTRREFQLLIKPALLEKGIVVAPSKGPKAGIFICITPEDFEEALRWYDDRIAAEECVRNKIERAREQNEWAWELEMGTEWTT
jgi:hypothetical protein